VAVAMVFVRCVLVLVFRRTVNMAVRVLDRRTRQMLVVVVTVVVTMPVVVFERLVRMPVRVALAEQQGRARSHQRQRGQKLQVQPVPEHHERQRRADERRGGE
jgi:hypothetical protein